MDTAAPRTAELNGIGAGNERVAVALENKLGVLVPVAKGVEQLEGDLEVASLFQQGHLVVGALKAEVKDVIDVQRSVLGVEGGGGESIQVLRTNSCLWDNLPAPLRHTESVTAFKTSLKTHLFSH